MACFGTTKSRTQTETLDVGVHTYTQRSTLTGREHDWLLTSATSFARWVRFTYMWDINFDEGMHRHFSWVAVSDCAEYLQGGMPSDWHAHRIDLQITIPE